MGSGVIRLLAFSILQEDGRGNIIYNNCLSAGAGQLLTKNLN
jgi:hypothetical protein